MRRCKKAKMHFLYFIILFVELLMYIGYLNKVMKLMMLKMSVFDSMGIMLENRNYEMSVIPIFLLLTYNLNIKNEKRYNCIVHYKSTKQLYLVQIKRILSSSLIFSAIFIAELCMVGKLLGMDINNWDKNTSYFSSVTNCTLDLNLFTIILCVFVISVFRLFIFSSMLLISYWTIDKKSLILLPVFLLFFIELGNYGMIMKNTQLFKSIYYFDEFKRNLFVMLFAVLVWIFVQLIVLSEKEFYKELE